MMPPPPRGLGTITTAPGNTRRDRPPPCPSTHELAMMPPPMIRRFDVELQPATSDRRGWSRLSTIFTPSRFPVGCAAADGISRTITASLARLFSTRGLVTVKFRRLGTVQLKKSRRDELPMPAAGSQARPPGCLHAQLQARLPRPACAPRSPKRAFCWSCLPRQPPLETACSMIHIVAPSWCVRAGVQTKRRMWQMKKMEEYRYVYTGRQVYRHKQARTDA